MDFVPERGVAVFTAMQGNPLIEVGNHRLRALVAVSRDDGIYVLITKPVFLDFHGDLVGCCAC
ncbi:hypothetical protein D3C86_1209690 [compost metagenome]